MYSSVEYRDLEVSRKQEEKQRFIRGFSSRLFKNLDEAGQNSNSYALGLLNYIVETHITTLCSYFDHTTCRPIVQGTRIGEILTQIIEEDQLKGVKYGPEDSYYQTEDFEALKQMIDKAYIHPDPKSQHQSKQTMVFHGAFTLEEKYGSHYK